MEAPTKDECICHNIRTRLVKIEATIRQAQKRMPVFSDALIVHDMLDEAIDYITVLGNTIHKQLSERGQK